MNNKTKYNICLLMFVVITGCNSASKEHMVNAGRENEPYFTGSIIIHGEIVAPLTKREFEKQYHFSQTHYKYVYKENDKVSGLIIDYSTRAVTCFAGEDTLNRKFTATAGDFIKERDRLEFFEDCVDRSFEGIYIPEFAGRVTDCGMLKKNSFDLLRYKDDKAKLEIIDLKINIPVFITGTSFIDVPGEVMFFPLLNEYQRDLTIFEKILLKTSQVIITGTEINGLTEDINFTLPEEYRSVQEISYSVNDEPDHSHGTRSRSLFDEFDD